MHRNIAVNAHLVANRVNFHAAYVEDKTVGQRGVDPVRAIGRLQFRRTPCRGLSKSGIEPIGQHHRGPVRGSRCARERNRVIGIAAAADLATDEFNIVGQDVELLGGDACKLLPDANRREMRRHRSARRETAGIISAGDGPLILCRIDLEINGNVLNLSPN